MSAASPAVALPEPARALVDRGEFAVLSTLDPDGSPHQCVLWVGRDGDEILFSTKRFRRQYLNLTADPRVSVLLYDRQRPVHYIRINGLARTVDIDSDALLERMSQAYLGRPYTVRDPEQEADRVTVAVSPSAVLVYGEPS